MSTWLRSTLPAASMADGDGLSEAALRQISGGGPDLSSLLNRDVARSTATASDWESSARTVLLLSDDPALRTMVRSFLEHVGIAVLTCLDVGRAGDLLDQGSGADLLVVDMGDCEDHVAEVNAMAAIRPGLRVLLLSGRSLSSERADECAMHGWQVMQKPVALPALLGAVQGIFDRMMRAQRSREARGGALPADGADVGSEANGANGVLGTGAPGCGRDQRWILSISEYEALSKSREALLRREGFGVISTSSREFVEMLDRRQFDVAVLCQSVPSERVRVVVGTLRRHAPNLPIVRVLPLDPGMEDVGYSCAVQGAAGPEEFLQAIQRLCTNHGA